MRPTRRAALLLTLLAVVATVALLGALAATPVFGGGGPPDGKGPPEHLRVQARPVFEVQGVVYTDAKDSGLLEIGVDNEGRARAVEAKLKQLGISLSSVEIVVTKPIVNLQTLRDRVRPLQGGLEITFIDSPFVYTCTQGFNAIRSGVEGYVTNAHCTAKEGEVDGTQHYQSTPGDGQPHRH